MRTLSRKLFIQYHEDGTEDLDEWRKIFVETRDPTEYRGALALVDTWKEWQRWKRDWPIFANKIIPEWLEEMEVLMRSEAIRSIVEKTSTEMPAARFIAEGKYNPKQAGRPSKAAIKREARIEAGITSEAEDDVARVKGPLN